MHDRHSQHVSVYGDVTGRIKTGHEWSLENRPVLILCELVWVLERAYAYKRAEVTGVLEQILRMTQFEVLEKDVVWDAWEDCRSGKGDFADYYLGRCHRQAGAEATLTFDKTLAGSALFELVEGK